MAVLKKIDAPFTQVANDLVDQLEIDELGALVKMLKKPADWSFSHPSLMADLNVGKDKLQSIVRKLKAVGALIIYPVTGSGGKVEEWCWQVSAMQIHQPENQATGSTSLENQQLENQATYKIKNLTNKDSSQLIKKTRKKKEAVKIPDDFELTDELLDWMEKTTPALAPAEAFADFVQFWKIDQGTKKDWIATFKKSMLNYVSWRKCLKDKGDSNGQENNKNGSGVKSGATRGISGDVRGRGAASAGKQQTGASTSGSGASANSGATGGTNGTSTGQPDDPQKSSAGHGSKFGANPVIISK